MITTLQSQSLPEFFSYLDLQLRENGKDGTPLFQPQSRSQSGFPREKKAAFAEGLSIPVGTPGWRRAWVYRDSAGEMVGHIDLRARMEPFTCHRALLGMGVDQRFRRQGIGTDLIDHVVQWAGTSGVVEIIDLEVLAHNERALKLYQKTGFEFVGRLEDMFRIDGLSEPYILMTRKLAKV